MQEKCTCWGKIIAENVYKLKNARAELLNNDAGIVCPFKRKIKLHRPQYTQQNITSPGCTSSWLCFVCDRWELMVYNIKHLIFRIYANFLPWLKRRLCRKHMREIVPHGNLQWPPWCCLKLSTFLRHLRPFLVKPGQTEFVLSVSRIRIHTSVPLWKRYLAWDDSEDIQHV